jgi:hypothetical protein
MSHSIREIAHFMNWEYLYVAFEVRLLASSYFSQLMNWAENEQRIAKFVKWARVIWPVHEMGNFTDGV